MASPLNLIPTAVGQGQERSPYATVVAPLPSAITDPLHVILPDWSSDYYFTIPARFWASNGHKPNVGDPAVLLRDGRGEWWCPLVAATGALFP